MTDAVDPLVELAVELLRASGDDSGAVIEFAAPEALLAALPIGLDGNAMDAAALATAARTIAARSVRTDHPAFVNQNFAGADPVAVAGDWLGAVLNTTTATYEAAPVFTLLERSVLSRMAAKAGWGERPLDDELPAGLFCPGGSTANLWAMQAARRRADPESLDRGARGGPRLVAFTSTSAHYSMGKSVRLLGIGADNLVKVPCDPDGAMNPQALADALGRTRAGGGVPFFINLTAGTTVTGAFDSIAATLEIVDAGTPEGQPRPWIHLDAAIGGAVLFSERERVRLQGVEAIDSITWNLHKLSGVTQQCSALLMHEPIELRHTFSTRANYLFQPDKNNAHYDAGDLTFQCARRNDALKAWLVWKARGEAALGARVERAVDLAARLEAWIDARDDFVLACPRTVTHVCFWWVPESLRPMSATEARSESARAVLHPLAPRIKNAMQRGGEALIGYQPVDGSPNAWRILFNNPNVTWEHAEAMMELIARLGTEAEA